MQFKYFDIHSHLNLKPLSDDVAGVISRMQEKSVGTITVGTGLETSKQAVLLAEQYPDTLWATVGIHPTDSEESFEREKFLDLARHSSVVAIGETGLDYFRTQDPEVIAKQVELFKKHIDLAIEVGKPLMLHVRASKGNDDAYYDALGILQETKSQQNQDFSSRAQQVLGPAAAKNLDSVAPVQANFHFFSGSKKCMEDIVAAGYTISVDGPITFTHEYDDMIRACPIDSLMAETDAPYACPEPYRSGGVEAAAPTPYRGKTCEPWMVEEVVKRIAEIKEIPLETVRLQMLQNVQKFFNIRIS